jgi:sugar lactone lactonase YvrE
VDVPDVAALRLASSWTISTWVNLTSLPGSAAEFILLDKDSTGGYTNYQLAYDNDTGNYGASAGWVVSYNVSGSTTNHYEKYVVTPSTGTWYLITGVYSSTAHTLTLYVNGVQEATGSVSGFTPDSAGGVDLGLGDEIGVGNNSNITIDDARVYNTALTAAQVAELYTWSTVSTGGYDTCAITTGGALYCWGYNTDGEDGNGGTTQSSIPVQVGSLTSWSTVSQGGYDTCGINAGGKLYCWGINEYGENGTNNTTQNKSPTEEHLSLTNWTAVSTDGSGGGLPDTCGLAGGKLYCWGYNNEGEDGVGNATEHNSPVQVGSLTTWTAVGYGNQDACAVNSSGLYCWGENAYGEDGLGNITAYNTPQPVTLGGITGEGATDEIGQYTSMTSTATDAWYNYGPNNGMNELGFEYPQGIALDPVNHYLYVSDCDNNRVMVYALSGDNSISASSPGHTASYVLGQTGLQAPNNPNTDSNPTQTNIGCPDGLAVDTVHSRLFVADTGGDRVLVFTTPVSSGQSASYVLGEPDFTSYDGSQTASQTQLFYPTDVAYDSTNNLLYVVDNGNIRVVVFNVAGLASNGISASYELGQATWTTQAVATTQTGMGAYLSGPGSNYAPEGLALDSVNNRLFVSDTANNRVLVFNVPLSANDISASYVLGQSSFTTGASATTQAGFQYPTGISYDSNNNRLFVADNWNQRVLAFNVAPGTIANGESAAFEVGQTAGGTQWTSNNTGLSQSGLNLDDGCNNGPCEFSGVKYDPGSGRLFVTDSVNNRIMIFGADFMPSWTSEPP